MRGVLLDSVKKKNLDRHSRHRSFHRADGIVVGVSLTGLAGSFSSNVCAGRQRDGDVAVETMAAFRSSCLLGFRNMFHLVVQVGAS